MPRTTLTKVPNGSGRLPGYGTVAGGAGAGGHGLFSRWTGQVGPVTTIPASTHDAVGVLAELEVQTQLGS